MARFSAAFEGKWKIQVAVPGAGGKPAQTLGTGEEKFYPGPGGRSFVEEYHSTGAEGEVSGLGVVWWNSESKNYEVLWCDNGTPNGCAAVKSGAKWEADDFVVLTTKNREGKKVNVKEVFSKSSPDSFTQTIYEAAEGGKWEVEVRIEATRMK